MKISTAFIVALLLVSVWGWARVGQHMGCIDAIKRVHDYDFVVNTQPDYPGYDQIRARLGQVRVEAREACARVGFEDYSGWQRVQRFFRGEPVTTGYPEKTDD